MTKPRRSIGLLLIESSAFASPFTIDDDHVVDGLAWLHEQLRRWLPGGEMTVVFPDDGVLSPWSRGIQARLHYVGVPTTSREGLAGDPRRTRMLWHVHSDGSSNDEDFRFSVRPDRVREVVVPLGEVVPWEVVANLVVEYAGVMSTRSTFDDSKLRDFDTYGLAEDEPEPF